MDARQTHGVVGSLKLKPAEMEVVEAHEDFSEEAVNEVVGTDGAELEESPALDLETSQDGFLERNQVQTNQKPTESKKWRRLLKKESCRCNLLKKINCSNIMLKILLNMESSNMAKILRLRDFYCGKNGISITNCEKQSSDGEGVSPMQHNGKQSHECAQCRKSF